MEKIKLQVRFVFNIGIGYRKDKYTGDYGHTGHLHTLMLPFCIVRWGEIKYNQIEFECPDCCADLSYTMNDDAPKFVKHNV